MVKHIQGWPYPAQPLRDFSTAIWLSTNVFELLEYWARLSYNNSKIAVVIKEVKDGKQESIRAYTSGNGEG
jgi:hypothetical protein